MVYSAPAREYRLLPLIWSMQDWLALMLFFRETGLESYALVRVKLVLPLPTATSLTCTLPLASTFT